MNKLHLFALFSMLCAFATVNISASQSIKNVSSLNLANIIFDNNRLSDIRDIMKYYGWIEGNDIQTWKNDSGDEIRVIADDDGRSLRCVELMTSDNQKLSERLSTLQYLPASKEQREAPTGHQSIPNEMYVSGHKCVAVTSRNERTLIIFFRLTRQGYTRFGPQQ